MHPAFSKNAEVGGGWTTSNGENIEGFWVGKFETTGEYAEDASKVTVKPGISSLRSMTINEQYKAGKSATFGEASSELIGSHMAKNSEWGAVAYLSQSSYGLNGKEIERNSEGYITGGSSTKATIYTTNAGQSTTGNAYGVYDMSGGVVESTANYVNCGSSSIYLSKSGGTLSGDLYGADTTEQSTSTKYKTVYKVGTSTQNSYNLAAGKKGDGVYETSNNYQYTNSWFGVNSYFPATSYPFFSRGGYYNSSIAGVFYFEGSNGNDGSSISFRVALAF